jgi:hypothetical protein
MSKVPVQLLSLPPRSWGSRIRESANLLASLAPGVLFGLALVALSRQPRFGWLTVPARHPWELWVIALAGTVATAAGIADWCYHRTAGVKVGPNERKAELLALAGGGLPLFFLMCAASVAPWPHVFLLPVLIVLMGTLVLICYDEFVFHRRRCGGFEALLHRTLLGGHACAFLAWAHFCFVREGFHG